MDASNGHGRRAVNLHGAIRCAMMRVEDIGARIRCGIRCATLILVEEAGRILKHIGNNVALVMIPYSLAKTTSFNGLNGENNELKEGVKLATWIDYYAVLRRLDVRVGRFGESKPNKALVSFRVNLGEMVEGEGEVMFGLVSSGGRNGENVTSVYSWWVEVKDVPKWMHSVAADPQKGKGEGSVCGGDFVYEKIGVVKAKDLESGVKK
ncbi:concanavalin A-like lectin/glucanase domain-containing protein [Artemisia annua]|uniref:Concanavalin A-like lectin/glucanase domain-containing protein n=1 Tax=Artemisia annua TaxID=35608 RepID=A0A2U1NV82_ARTAN|nr:concanavalin A-like lectin/glucanase domain-containing protein [Artemisia annua]